MSRCVEDNSRIDDIVSVMCDARSSFVSQGGSWRRYVPYGPTVPSPGANKQTASDGQFSSAVQCIRSFGRWRAKKICSRRCRHRVVLGIGVITCANWSCDDYTTGLQSAWPSTLQQQITLVVLQQIRFYRTMMLWGLTHYSAKVILVPHRIRRYILDGLRPRPVTSSLYQM